MAGENGAVERVPHGERFHEEVIGRGTGFASVFYLLLTLFVLGAVGSIVEAVTGGSLAVAVPGLLLGGLVLYFARHEDLYGIVATIILPYLILGLILTYTTATMLSSMLGTFTSPTLATAAFTAIPVLLLGAVAAYLFNAVSTSRRGLGGPALAGSTLIAIGAGTARLVQASIRQIVGNTSTNGGIAPADFLVMNAAPNPDLIFITVLLAFNLPFLYYGNLRFTLGRRDLVWYLIPLAVYVILGGMGSILLF